MIVAESTWNDLENYRDSLEHYGVLGMKWGVRKDRGSSGGGSKSTSSGSSKDTKGSDKEKAKAKKKADAEAAKKEAARKKILRDPSKLYKHRDEFTYDEIKEAMKRFDWEKQLAGYSKDRVAAGAKFVGDLFNLANNAINLYNAAARVANSMGDGDGPPLIKSIGDINAEKKDKKSKKG